ncbi:Protein TIS11 [Araneus ventricosus]|uniref:Protein TIS11 n=1 Tax=Araneus ventricosus TaxID=182803 RepID=A0A4Y2C1G7_ARAVE|nr:Protein TIS11 [Araneus ventricosus]
MRLLAYFKVKSQSLCQPIQHREERRRVGERIAYFSNEIKMNPNQEQSCFWSSGNNEDISLPDGSKFYYDSLASRAEVQKSSLPRIRLVGDNQTSHQLCSPSQLLKGQSFTCLTHPVDDHCPPISQFQESSCQLPAHSFDGQSWDLNHMPQRRLQDIENSEANFSFSQWPYCNDVHPQQIDNFLYPAQSLEINFSSPQQQEEIHLPPLQLPEVNVPPCCYFQSSSSEKDSFPHTLQVPYHSYELFPESENVFQIIWKLSTNTVDHSSNCRKRLPCFINITNKAQVDSPTVASQAGSVHWTDSDVNQAKNHRQLIDSPTMNTKAGSAMYLNDSDVNEASKMPIKIFSGFNVTNQVQVDSPMFSEAGSPEHLTASDANLAKNIEKLIDFLTKTTKAGTPIFLTDQNVNQTKNLQKLIDPTMTSKAGSPLRFLVPTTMTSKAGSPLRLMVLPAMTSQAGSPLRLIDPNQAKNLKQLVNSAMMTTQADSTKWLNNSNINQAMNLQQQIPLKSIFYKTELCRKFLEGHCELGIKCQFAHGRNDMRSVARHPMYKTRVCVNFLKFGYCRYADRCIFIHSANPTSSQPYNLGSDGETSPRSSYSSSPPYRNPIDLGAFVVKKGY